MAEAEQIDRNTMIGRVAALAALVLALLIVAWVLLAGGDDYEVKMRFANASQLVDGNLVQVAGRSVGTVEEIELTPNGQAEVTVKLDDEIAPLRQGTRAEIRIASLSGVANRYIDLRMPEEQGAGADIEDGGVIEEEHTVSQVEIDQLFATFDERTRKGLQNFVQGHAQMYKDRGGDMNAGLAYLSPSLVATRRLFEELNRDRPMLERFVVEQANLMTTISERREDLSALIDNLADMMGAIANERGALGEAIPRLPTFMRRANTTFVNLRATLDDLDPLVEESKPVAPKLRRYLQELRPFAEDARPTFRDLSAVTRSPGPDNDLLDLSRSTLPFRDIAVGPVQANGAQREGALPAAAKSLREQAPHMAFSRPYAVDLTQWFDDFSHSGIYDANGSASRIATTVNAFATVGGVLTPVAPALRNEVFERSTTTGQNNRCPGAMERDQGNDGIPFRPSPDFNCDPSQRPTGP